MARTLSDIVTTVLALNAARAWIVGGAAVHAFGARIPTPGFAASLLLLLVWVGAGALLRRRDQLHPLLIVDHVRRWVPEMIVGVLFAAGLVMRLTGIGFGEPLVLHPDEHVVVGASIHMLKNGSLAPPVPYHYPTVFYYLLLPAFGLTYVRGKSHGLWTSLNDIDRTTFEFYEVARAHSAVLGALTILLAFVLARRMWPGLRGRWTGVIAAAFVTFAFNHVKESHHAVTDAALAFFATLAFLAIVVAFQRETRAAFALAGFAVGIACATKYSALPLVPTLVAAHLLAERGRTDWRRLALGIAAVPAGFFAGYPYAILKWPPFLEHLGWMSGFSGARGFDAAARFEAIVGYAMESGVGTPFTLLFAAAAIWVVFRRRRLEALVVVFAVAALSLMSRTAFPFYPRYLLPLLPPAAVLAGMLIVDAANWLRERAGRRGAVLAPAAGVMAAAVMVVPQARESFEFLRYVTAVDTRVLAYRHILEHIDPNTVIASEEPYVRLPNRYRVLRWTPLHGRRLEAFADNDVAVLVMSAGRDLPDGSEDAERRRELRRQYPLRAAFPAGPSGHVGPSLEIRVRPDR